MSYIVASPGRTGSIFLSYYLKEYCMYKQNKMFHVYTVQKYFTDVEDMPSNFIIHCHSAASIPAFLSTKKLLLVTRDPIEIAVSCCIARTTGFYHFGSFDATGRSVIDYVKKYQNTTMNVDLKIFLVFLKEILEFYVQAFDNIDQATVFRYEQAIAPNSISQILSLDDFTPDLTKMSIAQPFNKWDMVEDKDKLIRAGSQLMHHFKSNHSDVFNEKYFNFLH